MLGLGSKAFRGTADDLAILNRALDQPVTITKTGGTVGDASLAKVKVTTITDSAMVMHVAHNSIARVAEDRPWASGDLLNGLGHTQRQDMLDTLDSCVCGEV